MNRKAKKIIDALGLVRHVEGGWYRFVLSGGPVIPHAALPANYSGDRESVSSIYYLLEGPDVSAWHKLHSDEIWAWHSGGSLKMTLGGEGSEPVVDKELFLGPRLAKGESYQIVAPARNWQTTRIINGSYALVSCLVSPAYHNDDFILYTE